MNVHVRPGESPWLRSATAKKPEKMAGAGNKGEPTEADLNEAAAHFDQQPAVDAAAAANTVPNYEHKDTSFAETTADN